MKGLSIFIVFMSTAVFCDLVEIPMITALTCHERENNNNFVLFFGLEKENSALLIYKDNNEKYMFNFMSRKEDANAVTISVEKDEKYIYINGISTRFGIYEAFSLLVDKTGGRGALKPRSLSFKGDDVLYDRKDNIEFEDIECVLKGEEF